MTLTGILKNILLVIISVLIWNTKIASIQIVGYGIALTALCYYSLGREQSLQAWQGAKSYANEAWNGPTTNSGNKTRLSNRTRRVLVVSGLIFFTTVVLFFNFGRGVSVSSLGKIGSETDQ